MSALAQCFTDYEHVRVVATARLLCDISDEGYVNERENAPELRLD